MAARRMYSVCAILACFSLAAVVSDDRHRQHLTQSKVAPIDPETVNTSYQPAIIGTATTSLFDYASEVGLELVHDKFASLRLPNTHTSWDIPVIGTVNLELSNIMLQSLDIASSSTGVAPNTEGGMTFIVNGLKTYVTCHFHYYKDSFPKVSGSGDADVRFGDGAVEYKLIPKTDADGRPMIISQEPAQVGFGVINVHTSHSSAAWLYNLFLSAFEGQFRGAITDEVSRSVITDISAVVDLGINAVITAYLHPCGLQTCNHA